MGRKVTRSRGFVLNIKGSELIWLPDSRKSCTVKGALYTLSRFKHPCCIEGIEGPELSWARQYGYYVEMSPGIVYHAGILRLQDSARTHILYDDLVVKYSLDLVIRTWCDHLSKSMSRKMGLCVVVIPGTLEALFKALAVSKDLLDFPGPDTKQAFLDAGISVPEDPELLQGYLICGGVHEA